MVIETTAHVGDDGILRLEIPVPERNQDVQVMVTISSPGPQVEDDWAELREKIRKNPELGKIFELPPPGRRKYVPFEPNEMPGPSASEILIRDRR
ncbi:MAG: hypothetical protein PHU85_03625 [Phycisphaerae bacterium]|nr:hypothetical protein [Phycisphaerae bacterium]